MKKDKPEYECDECGRYRSTDPNKFRGIAGSIYNAEGKMIHEHKPKHIYCAMCSMKIVMGIIVEVDKERETLTISYRKGNNDE
jgi:DNA-directed RNA polymerase subunit RPC12/RpoP